MATLIRFPFLGTYGVKKGRKAAPVSFNGLVFVELRCVVYPADCSGCLSCVFFFCFLNFCSISKACLYFRLPFIWPCGPERSRVISIARLCALPHLHLQPIDVIVFDDPCVEILS